ncbi:MAG: zinc metallopeptidase [Anaerolineales bacterium]|nr:zinc metallopeptidase [Anaerolineales bacterium]MCX7609648.1 zinc metallopeptidase [Anaerolineales bacterium]MDW8228150.1 zinc metallopeptidase [Anaerolineales bacterium]
MLFWDLNYLFYMLPAFVLMLLASWYVRSAYSRWSQVPVRSRITGYEAVQRLLARSGLYGIRLEGVAGELTDHYDPQDKVLRLSRSVAEGASVAGLAVAAHELGHALQDYEGYFPLRFRSALVPMVNIGSNLGWILIMVGLFLAASGAAFGVQVAWLGVLAFAGGAVFALATLPVELDASRRAMALLTQTGLIQTEEEQRGVRQVLNAAALTYVAGLATALLQLLYYVSLVSGLGRRDE